MPVLNTELFENVTPMRLRLKPVPLPTLSPKLFAGRSITQAPVTCWTALLVRLRRGES